MGDRAYVSVSVSTSPSNSLSAQEEWAFQNLANGVMPAVVDLLEQTQCDDEGYYPVEDGSATYTFCQSEVSVGYTADAATTLINHMRTGELPKRTFYVAQDGAYGDDMGWAVEYDAESDTVVSGNWLNGDFQFSLAELQSRLTQHHGDAKAMMRALLKEYHVRPPKRPSPVIDMINRANQRAARHI